MFYGREPWQITVDDGNGQKLTWPLIRSAKPNLPSGLRDGQREAPKTSSYLVASYQVATEFCPDLSKLSNVIKTKRKKKMTEAKQLQFQDPKLFRISLPCKSEFPNEKKGRGKKREKTEKHVGQKQKKRGKNPKAGKGVPGRNKGPS